MFQRLKNNICSNKEVILLVVGWLIIVNIFALVSLNRLNLKSDNAYAWVDNGRYTQD